MTIEIKQLVIRAVVEERRERAPGADAPRSQAVSSSARRVAPVADVGSNREIVIAECTRRVLRELRRGRGR
jgi:hypothetical protein